MPRRPGQLIEGGVYHVYTRVATGEGIFCEPEPATGFLDLVREEGKCDDWTVFASWALVPM